MSLPPVRCKDKLRPMKTLIGLCLFFCALQAHALTEQEQREIAEASEAAPAQITRDASFMIFRNGHFERIRAGTNNFTCLVMRDPAGRFEPACLNAQAMASVFPTYEFHTARLYEGATQETVMSEIKSRFDAGKLPSAAVGALVYMMSARNGRYDARGERVATISPHQMYFMPKIPNEWFTLARGPGPSLWQDYPHMSCLIVPVAAAAEGSHAH
jgi:hypothetical protein